MTPAEIIALLDLEPHPEGGYYTRTYQHDEGADGRGHGTAIYYLLEGGDFALWHMVDADENWHWYAGAPLTLQSARDGGPISEHRLGTDLLGGFRPQVLVPAHTWQRARSEGAWTLCGCTVSPGFHFEHYRLAERGWMPDTGA
ncbi:MAG: cupin domain-containing protein [Alphaproteobacteria bacterium]|nr:MAG: cupin domain-containing protein [Alphaproteobacteria bacterium]